MIVCHCNCIMASCIERSTKERAAVDPGYSPTPAEIYDVLGKQPCCGGCLPLAQKIISLALSSDRMACAACQPSGAAIALVAAE